jgi:hypothetical protein
VEWFERCAVGMFTLTHAVEEHMGKGMMKDSKDKGAMSDEHMGHAGLWPPRSVRRQPSCSLPHR